MVAEAREEQNIMITHGNMSQTRGRTGGMIPTPPNMDSRQLATKNRPDQRNKSNPRIADLALMEYLRQLEGHDHPRMSYDSPLR
jgi:hypothetical protein